MRTGLFKKFTQKLKGHDSVTREWDSIRLTITIPIDTYRSLQVESEALREPEVETLNDGTLIMKPTEFNGYYKREVDNDHPVKDLINSILGRYCDTGGVDWIDVVKVA